MRTIRIPIPMSESEQALLEAVAESDGFPSVGQYLRQTFLSSLESMAEADGLQLAHVLARRVRPTTAAAAPRQRRPRLLAASR